MCGNEAFLSGEEGVRPTLKSAVCAARVEVRAAPSLNFAYVEPRLMRLYLKFKRPEQAPSMVAGMSLQDFAMRAQKGCTDPPLFYQSGEYYYMQTHVTKEMRSRGDVDFKQPPFSVVLAPGEACFSLPLLMLC